VVVAIVFVQYLTVEIVAATELKAGGGTVAEDSVSKQTVPFHS